MRQQAITWANVDPNLCHCMVSVDNNICKAPDANPFPSPNPYNYVMHINKWEAGVGILAGVPDAD